MRRGRIGRARLALGGAAAVLAAAAAPAASAALLPCNGDARLCDRSLDMTRKLLAAKERQIAEEASLQEARRGSRTARTR